MGVKHVNLPTYANGMQLLFPQFLLPIAAVINFIIFIVTPLFIVKIECWRTTSKGTINKSIFVGDCIAPLKKKLLGEHRKFFCRVYEEAQTTISLNYLTSGTS